MNERPRKLIDLQIERKLVRASAENLQLNLKLDEKQKEATLKVMNEIQITGESVSFGQTFRELDSLASIPLKKQRIIHQERMQEIIKSLSEEFGSDRAIYLYSVWLKEQAKTNNF